MGPNGGTLTHVSSESQPPGWYQDPWAPGALRWWDGSNWTAHVSQGSHAGQATGGSGGRPLWPWILGGGLGLLLLLGIVGGLILFALGSDDSETVVTPGPPTAPATPALPPPSDEPRSNRLPQRSLGTSSVVRTQEGSRVRVTALEVLDPVRRGAYSLEPQAGTRWVGVLLRLEALGPMPYDDSPGNASRIFAGGRSYESDTASPDGCKRLEAVLKIPPGGSITGCVIFEVARGDKPTRLSYVASSGYSPDVASWRLMR